MFRKILTIAALSCGLAGFAASAEAMPMGNAAITGAEEAGITLVADGCGPGWFRGPYGRCRPAPAMRPRYAPRPYYAPPARCFVRRDFYGRPVRVCR